jgi:hypothetical protein
LFINPPVYLSLLGLQLQAIWSSKVHC